MAKKPAEPRVDVAIAGAGTAGLALAVALARSLKPGFSVAVCDPALGAEPSADDRVSAIAGGARRLLTALGVWERLKEAPQPIVAMEITDSRLDDAVRPTFLSFDAGEDEPAAHMAENRAVLVGVARGGAGSGRALDPGGGCRFQCA
jgi:2-octaprenyl-6-methoxyphenol hydroxylase